MNPGGKVKPVAKGHGETAHDGLLLPACGCAGFGEVACGPPGRRPGGTVGGKIRVYDEAAWHLANDWPRGLPREQACVHAGLYLGWLAERRLLSEELEREFQVEIEAFRGRQITGPRLYALAGRALTSEMLSAEGRAFTEAYYDLDSGRFLADYEAVLGAGRKTLFEVPDSWESYQALLPVLDERLDAFRARGARGRRR